MEVEEYARIAAAEDDHWWYRNARALMAELLQPWLGTDQRILDAGCGPGGNGAWLAKHGQVVSVDVAREALEFVRARRSATSPVQASAERLPFDDGAFDIAVGITLLYTVADDVAALGELARVLRVGGAVLLLEPAFPSLRRAHDVTVHGLRRYRRDELAALAEQSALRVRRATYAYSFLAPPAAVLASARFEPMKPSPPVTRHRRPENEERRDSSRARPATDERSQKAVTAVAPPSAPRSAR